MICVQQREREREKESTQNAKDAAESLQSTYKRTLNTSFSNITHKQRKKKDAFWGVKEHLGVVVVYDI